MVANLHISTQLLKQNYLEGISFTLEIQLFTWVNGLGVSDSKLWNYQLGDCIWRQDHFLMTCQKIEFLSYSLQSLNFVRSDTNEQQEHS